MSIEFQCDCGKKIRTSDSSAGKRGKCPGCGKVLTVPTPVAAAPPEPDPLSVDDAGEIPLAPRQVAAQPVGVPAPHPLVYAPTAEPKWRGYLYFALLVLLLPLAWSTFHAAKDEFADHLKLTVQDHPELQDKLDSVLSNDNATTDDIIAALPADKLDGAMLARHTWAHWGLAAAAAALFFGLILLIFPRGHAKPHHLPLVGVFTGTAGILLLLGLQWAAFHMPLFSGHGWITLLLDLVWLIGQSYIIALGDHGFWLSFLGFTAGVGFCEEACKALPILFLANRGIANWRTAMLWGLLSGAGFGISEAITYCSDSYNGICGPQIYAVRFISCVGLHAMWAAAVGITIFRNQHNFQERQHPLMWIFNTLRVVIVPMILHGLYDTLLKQQYDGYALLVAVASFAWLTFQIEWAKRSWDLPNAALA